jgi:peptide deformylase
MLNIEIWKENKILRKVSEKINNSEIKKYIKLGKEMIKYIKNSDNWWVWLAAPQVWYNKRLITVSLLKDRDDENFSTLMMINPEIIEHNKILESDTEWCLSVPWEKWEIERFQSIKLKYTDEKTKERTLILSSLSARIVQHEIDHLDWILFTDKLKN